MGRGRDMFLVGEAEEKRGVGKLSSEASTASKKGEEGTTADRSVA